MKSVSILYLGKRGGGAKFTIHLVSQIAKSDSFVLDKIILRPMFENFSELRGEREKVFLFQGNSFFASLREVLYFRFFPERLLTCLGLNENSIVLVPMISPLGLIVEHTLEKCGVRFIRFIHDAQPHPGELWPRKRTLNRIIKGSSYVVALSRSVAQQAYELNSSLRLSIYPHPIFLFENKKTEPFYKFKYILFIGRIRKYKGVETLVEAYGKLQTDELKLVIAGQGSVSIQNQENVIWFSRWLTEIEISNLVEFADLVVLPYLEASQSGFLPYLIFREKIVVVTPQPGLLEQADGYENLIVTKDTSVESIMEGMRQAICFESRKTHFKSKHIQIEEVIIDSGFYE